LADNTGSLDYCSKRESHNPYFILRKIFSPFELGAATPVSVEAEEREERWNFQRKL